MVKKAAGSKPVWSIAGNPLQTTSLKAGLLDSIFWPNGMNEPVKKNFAMILAQVIFPLREQTAYNQVQIEKLMQAAGAQPAGAQAAASAGSDGSDASRRQGVKVSASATAAESDGNPALDPSLCFKLTEEDLAVDPVQAAVGRLEACALGILETLKETIPAMQCIPLEARNLPSMSIPHPVARGGGQDAVFYGPFAAPVPQAYPGGPLQVYPNLGAPVACSPAAPPQACSSGLLEPPAPPAPPAPPDPNLPAVVHAQKLASRARSSSPAPNVPVVMPDGHQTLKPWPWIEAGIKNGTMFKDRRGGWLSTVCD